MKRLILFLLVSITIANAQSAWVSNPGPGSISIRSMVVAGSIYFVGGNTGVYYSNDQGATWTLVNTGLTNTSVRHLLINGSVIYAATAGGIFASNITGNSTGISWVSRSTGLTALSVNRLAINGSTLFAATNAGGVFRSIDGGANWLQVNNGLTVSNVTTLLATGSKIYAGVQSGVFVSTDNGDSWASRSNSGYTGATYTTEIFLLGTELWGGTAKGAFRSLDDGNNWIFTNSGMPTDTDGPWASDGVSIYRGVNTTGNVYKLINNEWILKSNSLPISGVNVLYIYGSNIFAGFSGGDLYKRLLSDFSFPTAPSNLISTSISTNQINLTWSDNSNDETQFTLIRSQTSGSGYSVVFNPASGTTTYNNSGLTAGTRYYYRIRAENNRDHSPYTSEISRITIPSTPNLVSPSQVTDSTFRLNIPTVTGASEFHFDVSTDNSFSTFLYQGLVSSTNFINITGLTPATTYYFRYRPVNESGFGANSSVFNATTNSPPLALTASETGQNTFKAHWTPVASASNYRIDLSTDNFITFVQLNQYTIDTFYVFTSLPHSTTYQYRVRTINLNGNPSVNSNIINVTTSAPPIVPPVLSLYNYADRIQLSWFGGNYYNKVDIERSDGNNSNYITIASNLSGSYFDDILTQSGTYYYRLKVFNPLNEYSYSNEESSSFTLVGITDKINNSFTIYPNPSEGILFIEFKNNNYDYELRIINSLGKVVWNQRINSKYSGSTNEQNLTQLENGIYYVEIFEIGSNKSSRTLFVKH